MSEPFLRWARGDVTAVRFLGPKIALDDRESLYGLVEEQAVRKLVIDFKEVKLLSSAPIGLLVNLKQKLEAAGGRLALCQLHPDIREILRLTSVEGLFDIFDSEQDAIDALKDA